MLDGRYRLEERLGEGGMGEVWRAMHVRIGRPVAVKLLRAEVSASPREAERFRREARIAVQLSSPHVIDVLDFGDAPGGGLYLVMELLEGESLRDRLRRVERIPPEEVSRLLRQLLDGLAAAHRAGIVHRDLKPENLWLVPHPEGEQLKILDFGIAKVSAPPPGSEKTQAGLVVGTPQFLSPEQAIGAEVDHRADLYSAGIVAYLLLTGRHPFATSDPRTLLRAHAYEAIPSPAREVPELVQYPALLRFVARATEKDRNLRAQSAAELLDVLEGGRGATTPRPGAVAALAPPRAAGQAGILRAIAATLQRGRTATFLRLDAVGHGGLVAARRPEEVAALLAEHGRLLSPALHAFRGRPVRPSGGGFVAAFRSPTNAVLCAMAIQDRLAARNASSDGDRLAVRAAVHLGEAREEEGDLAGPALEAAADVARAASAGEIRLTRSVYLAMTRGEVRLEPLAPMERPGEPMPLYRVERSEGAHPYGGREAAAVGVRAPGPRVRTENRVVLLADMRGSTAAVTGQTREEGARMRALHDALVLPVLRLFRGTRVKSVGDAYLVLFDRPTDALLCAAAIQDRLWAYDRQVPEAQRIEVRVAIAMGEVRLAHGDVFGEAVNLAARIEAEAEAGEIWFGESVFWAMDRDRVPAEDMGSRPLKGFAEVARLFRVAREAGAGAPYANAGLAGVKGLAEPDPAALARRAARAAAARRWRAPLAVGVALSIAALALAANFLLRPSAERLVARGRLDDAAEQVASLADRHGEDHPEVLYLQGLVDAAQAQRGAADRLPGAFHAWSRALAGGSDDALAALEREGASPECERRRLAARALSASRSRAALGALRAISDAEPPPPVGPGALARVLREVGASVRCGAGDLARDGLAALEGG